MDQDWWLQFEDRVSVLVCEYENEGYTLILGASCKKLT